ncbi:MAG: hypothetical protein RIR17_66 [Planctomycetota bacterium]|jgi:hypothetical protein
MKKIIFAALITSIISICTVHNSLSFANDGPKSSVLKGLKKGQVVTLKEHSSNYSITVFPGLNFGSKVQEVGTDYVVIEDPSEAMMHYIPVTSIKAITIFKPGFGGKNRD